MQKLGRLSRKVRVKKVLEGENIQDSRFMTYFIEPFVYLDFCKPRKRQKSSKVVWESTLLFCSDTKFDLLLKCPVKFGICWCKYSEIPLKLTSET